MADRFVIVTLPYSTKGPVSAGDVKLMVDELIGNPRIRAVSIYRFLSCPKCGSHDVAAKRPGSQLSKCNECGKVF